MSSTEQVPPEFGLQRLIGFSVDSADGRSEAALDVDERHLNPHGVVHGAVMFALLDTAMGGATSSVIEPGSICATIDVTTRFLAPCTGGRLTAVATVRRAGRRVVHLDASVTTDDGTEVVAATGAFAVLPGPS